MGQNSGCSERLLGIGHVCRLHYIRAHQLLERLDLYRGQPKVLYALWEEEGLSHTDLAARIHVSAPTVTKMVQRLVKAGMLVCRDDPQDQRVSRIYLTEAGRAIRSQVDHAWAKLDTEALAGFSDAERAQFVTYLRRVEQNLILATSGELPPGEANGVDDHESEENVECN